MASEFDTAFAAAVPTFLARFGETVSYTPVGGDARSISAMIDGDRYSLHETGQATTECKSIEIEISSRNDTEDVVAPNYLAHGQRADSFTWQGETWYVIAPRNLGEIGTHRILACNKQLDPERVGV